MKKMIFVFMAIVLLCGWGGNASMATERATLKSVIVKENDTLWDIASKEVNNKTDIRKYIYEIKKLNQITDSGTLVPGRTIRLPAVE